MKNAKVIRAYAHALFDMARDGDVLDRVYEELRFLDALAREHADWQAFVRQLALPEARRDAVLTDLFKGRLHDLTFRLLLIMSDARELGLLPDVLQRFGTLYRRQRNVLSVSVVTASPLGDDGEAAIRHKLSSRFGGQIETSVSVDASLLGGVQVQVGDTVYDFSLSGQMELLKRKWARA